MALHKEKERICRQLGNLDGLQRTLGNQALILQACGDLDGAMALHKEEERICRQVGTVEGLAVSLANQASVLWKMERAREGLPLAEEAHRLAAGHGYAALARQFGPFLNGLRQAAQSEDLGKRGATATTTLASQSQMSQREPSIRELRDLAATAMKRGLWEAAETYLEKLLQQGEPVETVAPDLITALLNAHETLTSHAVTRIETLLGQLDSAGHTALAAPFREKLTAKLDASKPKKPWWKFGR
jgi:tetratricopeptide (TPR) repeat protein